MWLTWSGLMVLKKGIKRNSSCQKRVPVALNTCSQSKNDNEKIRTEEKKVNFFNYLLMSHFEYNLFRNCISCVVSISWPQITFSIRVTHTQWTLSPSNKVGKILFECEEVIIESGESNMWPKERGKRHHERNSVKNAWMNEQKSRFYVIATSYDCSKNFEEIKK